MSGNPTGKLCPHCGSETGIERGTPAELPVQLTLAEFETLVRNEWRRRLGPEAYDRAHSGQIIRDLTAHLDEEGGEFSLEEVEAGLERVMADLRVEGKGRKAFLHEVAKLRHAIRSVLKKAGADFVTSSDYVGRTREVLDEGLGSFLPRREPG